MSALINPKIKVVMEADSVQAIEAVANVIKGFPTSDVFDITTIGDRIVGAFTVNITGGAYEMDTLLHLYTGVCELLFSDLTCAKHPKCNLAEAEVSIEGKDSGLFKLISILYGRSMQQKRDINRLIAQANQHAGVVNGLYQRLSLLEQNSSNVKPLTYMQ